MSARAALVPSVADLDRRSHDKDSAMTVPRRLDELDGVRALAVLLVFAVHTDQTGWFSGGEIGVDLFFVLSGFLITDQLVRGADQRLGEFLARRLARLWPTLLLLVAVSSAAAVVTSASARAGIPSALYVYNELVAHHVALGDDSFVSHTWSLSIEMQFYVGWGLLATWLLRKRGRSVALRAALVLAVVSYLVRCSYVADDNNWAAYFTTESRLDAIFVGSALALLPDRRHRTVRIAAAPAPLLLALTVVAAIAFGHLSTGALLIGSPVAAAASACVIAGAVSGGAARTRAVLATAPLVWIGVRSYSLYLWHQPVFVVLQFHSGLHGTGLIVVQWTVSFVVAALSFRFVETPARRYLYARIGARHRAGT